MSDLIEGIYRLMMSAYDQPVNIGNPAEMTMLEFAREIIRATGSRSRIVFRPLPQDDPRQRRPDITRASEDSGLGAESAVGGRAGQDHRVFPEQSLSALTLRRCDGVHQVARAARVLREVHPAGRVHPQNSRAKRVGMVPVKDYGLVMKLRGMIRKLLPNSLRLNPFCFFLRPTHFFSFHLTGAWSFL